MEPVYLLVNSPSVGPLTWAPVAERLRAAGAAVVVPSLVSVTDGGPPFWPAVAEAVAAVMSDDSERGRERDRDGGRDVVLVVHSNAGLFAPVMVDALARTPAGVVFVDAALPDRHGATPVVSPEALEFLRLKADAGRLPPWTEWFDEAEVAPMFPDAGIRRAVEAEQPRLPLSYYGQRIPAIAGWDARPCGYLLFGPPYDAVAKDARERGWDVEHLPGRHLHQIVDPDGVAAAIQAMAGRWLR
ncbi:alpha/beta hydrolase [Actinoplanes sp. NBC_00393]|uniref:alpha/beta hydrolase n=1 Tax=Actinoplanes sp. NBC_00393 TaxID=2975953 RepID=UPI002E1BF985